MRTRSCIPRHWPAPISVPSGLQATPHRGCAGPDRADDSSAAQAPDPHAADSVGGREQPPVRAEADAEEPTTCIGVRQREETLSGACVPDDRRPVVTSGRDPGSVRAVGDVVDGRRRPDEGEQSLAGPRVPDRRLRGRGGRGGLLVANLGAAARAGGRDAGAVGTDGECGGRGCPDREHDARGGERAVECLDRLRKRRAVDARLR